MTILDYRQLCTIVHKTLPVEFSGPGYRVVWGGAFDGKERLFVRPFWGKGPEPISQVTARMRAYKELLDARGDLDVALHYLRARSLLIVQSASSKARNP